MHQKISQIIWYTLLGTNISHLWKRNIIFPATFKGDMLVPWRVVSVIIFLTFASSWTLSQQAYPQKNVKSFNALNNLQPRSTWLCRHKDHEHGKKPCHGRARRAWSKGVPQGKIVQLRMFTVARNIVDRSSVGDVGVMRCGSSTSKGTSTSKLVECFWLRRNTVTHLPKLLKKQIKTFSGPFTADADANKMSQGVCLRFPSSLESVGVSGPWT